MSEETAKAIKQLIEALKDESYWISWQANIAMSFQDECARNGIKGELIHKLSNEAATNFLHLLCRESK